MTIMRPQHLRHPNNPVMNWCVSNLAVEENAWQEIRPVKISQRQRIDGPVVADAGLYPGGEGGDLRPLDEVGEQVADHRRGRVVGQVQVGQEVHGVAGGLITASYSANRSRSGRVKPT